MNKKLLLTLVLLVFFVLSLSADSFIPFMETEQGTIGLLHHTYQNGATSDEFDFIKQGGQNNLYPFSRYSVGARIGKAHRIWLTYQPLLLNTTVEIPTGEVITIGGKDFEGAMAMSYGFPFYRATYTYDVLRNQEEAYLGIGLALQIRNASIQFCEIDGGDCFVSQNVGLVPALAIYSEYHFPFGMTLSADIIGSYANSAYFNGADYPFEGSILDASLRIAYDLPEGFSLFANARFFGGTAEGESENDSTNWTDPPEDYTKNNIASLTFSLGLAWQMQ
ncbi:MAG: hypothetical protein ACQ5SW_00145 [Sphaerochaetaceae bacterium]